MNKTSGDTAGGAMTKSLEVVFNGPLCMDVAVLADQPEHIYISSVRIQVVGWKNCRLVRGIDDWDGRKKIVALW